MSIKTYLGNGIRRSTAEAGLSRKWLEEMSELMEIERSDNNLVELIDTKLQLNFEIEKDERY
ncbi:hypothetical protein EPI10_028773 [Gossypium australe]|uniref:Uncharacterized protein n=1 Tax=Gossypium australe TaxID=47621 RepID=A0A5B6UYX9_9ROSI|nr:hypothetical protein EPI10_028773 [Gossypium australe]